MNRIEYLLGVVAEEATETAQAALKALRFGLDDHHPDNDIPNREKLVIEYNQLQASMQLLDEAMVMSGLKSLVLNGRRDIRDLKQVNVLRWAERSIENGTLSEPLFPNGRLPLTERDVLPSEVLNERVALWTDLPTRVQNILACENIVFVKDLLNCSEVDILKMPHAGGVTLTDIKSALNKRGLYLRPYHLPRR